MDKKWWDFGLECARVILAWPVVALVLGLVLMLRFDHPIRLFLKRVGIPKFFNSVEISAQQASAPEVPDSDEMRILLDAWTKAEVGRAQVEKDREQLLQAVQDTQLRAAFWEFRYLSVFLVPKTRLILGFLAGSDSAVTLQAFNALWPQWNFGDENERDAVLKALADNGLVAAEKSHVLVVTQKGLAFLNFVGQAA